MHSYATWSLNDQPRARHEVLQSGDPNPEASPISNHLPKASLSSSSSSFSTTSLFSSASYPPRWAVKVCLAGADRRGLLRARAPGPAEVGSTAGAVGRAPGARYGRCDVRVGLVGLFGGVMSVSVLRGVEGCGGEFCVFFWLAVSKDDPKCPKCTGVQQRVEHGVTRLNCGLTRAQGVPIEVA